MFNIIRARFKILSQFWNVFCIFTRKLSFFFFISIAVDVQKQEHAVPDWVHEKCIGNIIASPSSALDKYKSLTSPPLIHLLLALGTHVAVTSLKIFKYFFNILVLSVSEGLDNYLTLKNNHFP